MFPPFLYRFEQNYRPNGHTIQFLDFWLIPGHSVIAYWLILLSSYIVVCMHVLIDGCYWNTPPLSFLPLPLLRRSSHPPLTSLALYLHPDAHCRYHTPTHAPTHIHRIFSLVLPTIIWALLLCYPSMLGIRGSMQVYTALVCHAKILFFLISFERTKIYHKV
ncbi:hypothetical protein B0F90DRAFT_421998 [Multifurca ochricompacta]|uniref:Uncharacterized protein n=1 Tax=Multifurca ochricompacta TaxID=376703 RepID=A0AAD4M3K3_9AGAM|nr:hypothetical protein B0F90DRAFT_421998 [Multifurca ochricompacta]